MKTKIICIFLICLFCFTACTSVKRDPIDPQMYSPAAVVSICGNDEIYWYNEEQAEQGLFGELFDLFVQSSGNEKSNEFFGYTRDLMYEAEYLTMKCLTEKGFTLIPKEEVINNDSYLLQDEDVLLSMSDLTVADGYKLFSEYNNVSEVLNEKIGAKSVIKVNFSFAKTMVNGIEKNGTMTAYVIATVSVYNANGNLIAEESGASQGEKRIPIVAGIYEPSELFAMYPYAMEKALKSACSKL